MIKTRDFSETISIFITLSCPFPFLDVCIACGIVPRVILEGSLLLARSGGIRRSNIITSTRYVCRPSRKAYTHIDIYIHTCIDTHTEIHIYTYVRVCTRIAIIKLIS